MFWNKEPSDEQVVGAVLRGARDDFAILVRRYRRTVYAVALAETGRWADAEDIVQDTFLKAYEALDAVREKKCIRGWLFAIAQNAARSMLRRRKHEVLMEQVPEDRPASPPEEPMTEDTRDQLLRLLNSLKEEDRHLVTMHYFSGMRSHEIAETLGISSMAVRKRLQRAREGLGGKMLAELSGAEKLLPDPENDIKRVMAAIATIEAPWMPRAAIPAGEKPALLSGHGERAVPGKGGSLMSVLKEACAIAALLAICTVGWGGYRSFVRPENTVTVSSPAVPAVASHEEADEGLPFAEDDRAATQKEAVGAQVLASAVEPLPFEPQSVVQPRAPEMQPLGTISGVVVDASDSPIEGTSVSASGSSASGHTQSDGDGAFTIQIAAPAAPPSPSTQEDELLLLVDASHPGYNSASQLRVPLGQSDLILKLTQGGEIRGYVMDKDTQEPVPKFEARISREKDPVEGVMGSGNSWTSFDSPEGRFVLPTRYDTTQIEARAEGRPLKATDLYVRQGEVSEDVIVELESGFDIAGIVLDKATRSPIEGARVSVPSGEIRQWWGIQDENFDAITGADGRFRISGKAASDNPHLLVWHRDYAPEYVLNLDERSARDVRVLLSAGSRVLGRVTRGGQPVPNLRIHYAQTFGVPQLPDITPPEELAHYTITGTDADGRYELDRVPQGRYFVRIIDADPNTPLPRRYLGRFWVDVPPDKTLEVAHEVGEFAVISGSITGVSDFNKVRVSLYDQRYPEEFMYMTGEKHSAIGPDEQGRFQFPPVPAGTYRVLVDHAEGAFAPVEQWTAVSPGENVELTVEAVPRASPATPKGDSPK